MTSITQAIKSYILSIQGIVLLCILLTSTISQGQSWAKDGKSYYTIENKALHVVTLPNKEKTSSRD